MTKENIALVRATNVIPYDGIVRSISNSPYLTKKIGNAFSSKMSEILKEEGIIPSIDYSKIGEEDYYDNYVKLAADITREYMPFTSDYNSFVLFVLNGLCPDDKEHGFGNNTFSNKKCAIIEPLSYHIEEAVSLVPTDTAIKGNVQLSDEAILLIEENYYNTLSEKEKRDLETLNFKVKRFTKSIKEAVKEELAISGKYTVEDLSLSQSTGGIMPSATSEELKETIKAISSDYELSDKKYFNLITTTDETMPKYESVKDEYSKMVGIDEYYMSNFLRSLLTYLNVPEYEISRYTNHLESSEYMNQVKSLIKEFKIVNYKAFVDQYNNNLLRLQREGMLPTPSELMDEENSLNLK